MKNKSKIEDRIISKIEKGEVKMKPKSYFILRSILFVFSLLLLTLFLLYIGSLIMFVLRINDIFLLRGMGLKGVRAIFISFPWYLVFLSLFLITLVQFFSSRYPLIYRRPLLFSFIAILLFSILGSFLVEISSLHHYFFKKAQKQEMFMGGGIYRNLGDIDLDYRYFGIVLSIDGTDIVMKKDNEKNINVEITRETRGKRMLQNIRVGSQIVVIGEIDDDSIRAHAIRCVNGNSNTNER